MSHEIAFPTSADEITPAWIEDALRGAGAIAAGDEIVGVSASRLGAGAGFMGDVARLRLEYRAGCGPVESVVVKSATPDPALREVIRGFRNYDREVGFFQTLAPELGAGVPRCYAAEIDVPSNHFVLVLEDLAADFRDGDQVAGATLEEATQCLDVQVDLHARYWDARRRPELAWVPRVDAEFFVPTMMGAFGAGWAGVQMRFPELVPAPLAALGAAFVRHIPAMTVALASCPQTLVHSDFRLDNIMFARTPGDLPVKVLDWQGVLISAGVHDVAFLLSQNLAAGVREAHERELVEHYAAGLVARGITDYPVERVWEDYRLAVLLEWVYAVIIGGSIAITDERSRELFATMVRRSGQAIVDLDALALLPEFPA
jgi:hypothetical protein